MTDDPFARYHQRIDAAVQRHGKHYDPVLVRALHDYPSRILQDPVFRHLPPLFSDAEPLPLAELYVELSVSARVPGNFADTNSLTGKESRRDDRLAEFNNALLRRHESRLGNRLSPRQALDDPRHRKVVILGDPGSGKSSLLLRLMHEIITGTWLYRLIPFHISLRKYQYDGKVDSMLYHAICDSLIPREYTEVPNKIPKVFRSSGYIQCLINDLESLFRDSPSGQIVFLLDGLDEVSSDPDVRRLITNEIINLTGGHSPAISWIVTSRRAGFYGGLHEDVRFDVADLDQEGAQTLAGNWFRHMDSSSNSGERTRIFLGEVRSNHRLTEMARNPFLLTLLCFLRQRSGNPLPLNRAEVYRKLINLVRRQWEGAVDGKERFSTSKLDQLAAFCHHLYTDAYLAPKNLFDEDDWERYFKGRDEVAPDLRTPFLASRLLDQWGDQQSGYHLVHLTFQEYLIAHHVLSGQLSLEAALVHRYAAHWREPLRFLGACLWNANRKADFQKVLDALLERIDLAGILYVIAARLLLEVDVERALRDYAPDLCDRLWRIWEEGQPYVKEAAGEALALLDPQETFSRLRKIIADYDPADGQAWTPEERLRRYSRFGESALSDSMAERAVVLLGKVTHPKAAETLLGLFRDGKGTLPMVAAKTLARMEDESLRQQLHIMAAGMGAGDPLWQRFLKWVGSSGHPEHAPLLRKHLATVSPDRLPDLLEALEAVPSGPDNADAILARLQKVNFAEDPQTSGLLITALGRCGREAGRDWFVRALKQAGESAWRTHLLCHGSEGGLTPDEELLFAIQSSEDAPLLHCLVEGVKSWAEAGNSVSDGIVELIFDRRNDADESLRLAVFHTLSFLLTRDGQKEPTPGYKSYFHNCFRDPNFSCRGTAGFTLAHWGDPQVDQELVLAALNPWEDVDVRVSILGGFQGSVHRHESGRSRYYDELFPLIFVREPRLREAASDLMAQVRFPVLHWHGKAFVHREAITRRCAEDGFLVFKEFFVDEKGQVMTLPSVPPLDVLILTALDEEMERVKSHMDNPHAATYLKRDGWRSTLTVGEQSLELGLFSFQGMGNPQAAAKTVMAIKETQAELVVLIGILGGRKGRRENTLLPKGDRPMLGDVVVAEALVDYERGKSHPRPKPFELRSTPLRCDERLLHALKNRNRIGTGWTSGMKVARPDGTGRRILPVVHFGTVASGEKVVADNTTLRKLVQLLAEKEGLPPLLGVEMEGYGTALGSYETDARFLFVKGISDWADPNKSDDGWRPYAADAAAALVFDLLGAGTFSPRRVSGAIARPTTEDKTASFPPTGPATYSGQKKVELCRRLGADWEDVASVLEISPPDRRRFRQGRECEGIWDWLDDRRKLQELPDALRNAGREDLARLFEP
ncbi:MAG: NACHT domain-containing protein [Magnetococcus sp. YQC-5]